MSENQCLACGGSGYQGPYNAPDVPMSQRTIGCWPCPVCLGSGRLNPIPPIKQENQAMSDAGFKFCPFCGGDAFHVQQCTESAMHRSQFFPEFIRCLGCDVYFRGEGAHAKWNTRRKENPWHYPAHNLDLPNLPEPGQIVVAYYIDGDVVRGPTIMGDLNTPDGPPTIAGKSIYQPVVRWSRIPEE